MYQHTRMDMKCVKLQIVCIFLHNRMTNQQLHIYQQNLLIYTIIQKTRTYKCAFVGCLWECVTAFSARTLTHLQFICTLFMLVAHLFPCV
jgi:hypothetical protein